jgi:hypothetical protein
LGLHHQKDQSCTKTYTSTPLEKEVLILESLKTSFTGYLTQSPKVEGGTHKEKAATGFQRRLFDFQLFYIYMSLF